MIAYDNPYAGGAYNPNDVKNEGQRAVPRKTNPTITPLVDYKRDETYQEMPSKLEPVYPEVNNILEQRGKRYGSFVGQAHVTDRLSSAIEDELQKRNKKLLPVQQQAINMIVSKLARIINGDSNYDDNWIDIAGYSQLVVDYLHGKLT